MVLLRFNELYTRVIVLVDLGLTVRCTGSYDRMEIYFHCVFFLENGMCLNPDEFHIALALVRELSFLRKRLKTVRRFKLAADTKDTKCWVDYIT